jgi:cell division protein FtsQ
MVTNNFYQIRGIGFIVYQDLGDFEEDQPEEKQNNNKSNKKINVLKILLYYIIIGFLGWNFFYFIFTSTLFNIKEVNISGNNYLSGQTIINQGGVEFQINLFHFDTNKAKLKLLQNPWIAEVSIKKALPNKLNINIVERKPGILLYYNEKFYLTSEEGVVLEISPEFKNDFDLYLITGIDISNKEAGDLIRGQKYENVKRIIYALENIFPDQFYKIQVISNDEHLLFHKKKEIKVRIKDGDQLINEWYLLERVLEKVFQEESLIQEINMKYKERLSIILKE